jgi:hypothetical protein
LCFSDGEPLEDFDRVYPELVAYLGSRHFRTLTFQLNQQLAEAEKDGNESKILEIWKRRKALVTERRRFDEARQGKWTDLFRRIDPSQWNQFATGL